jgi:hypothetical protein
LPFEIAYFVPLTFSDNIVRYSHTIATEIVMAYPMADRINVVVSKVTTNSAKHVVPELPLDYRPRGNLLTYSMKLLKRVNLAN